MMENLVWKAYYHSMSGHEIRPFNIFEHGRFREEVWKLCLYSVQWKGKLSCDRGLTAWRSTGLNFAYPFITTL